MGGWSEALLPSGHDWHHWGHLQRVTETLLGVRWPREEWKGDGKHQLGLCDRGSALSTGEHGPGGLLPQGVVSQPESWQAGLGAVGAGGFLTDLLGYCGLWGCRSQMLCMRGAGGKDM